MTDNKDWIGKRIYLILKTGRKYSGKVISFDNLFLSIIDKFGEKVMVSVSDISSLEEEP